MDTKHNKTVTVRAMYTMAILTVVLSLATVAYASPASPFTGQWQAIDLDGSDLRLAIGGPPTGPFQITWTDNYMDDCNGNPGMMRGTGLLNEADTNFLDADLHLKCFTTGVSQDLDLTFQYHPSANTLSMKYDSGLVTLWHRPGERQAAAIFVSSAEDVIANDGVCTLREAIIATNTNAPSGDLKGECRAGDGFDTDIIVLAAGQTYSLVTDGTYENNSGTGDLDILNNSNGYDQAALDLIIAVNGTGTAIISQDATVDDRVLENHGATVQIVGLTLTGGSSVETGGGLLNSSGILAIHNSQLSGNSANTGGALANWGGSVSFTKSIVSANTALLNGGGISNQESGKVTIQNGSVVSGNSAVGGGGLFNDWSMITVIDSTVSGNSVTGYGGGILNWWNSVVTITDSNISGNTAGWGGGVYNMPRSSVKVNASIVSGNSASNVGGGFVNNSSGHISITGSAILANTSTGDGDAFYFGDYRPYATVVNESCIAGNGDTAVYNGGEEYTQDFTRNWWGDASGPGGAGPGSGDSVAGLIDFSDWLIAPPAICAP